MAEAGINMLQVSSTLRHFESIEEVQVISSEDGAEKFVIRIRYTIKVMVSFFLFLIFH